MRSALFVAVALVAACKGDPVRPDAAEVVVDAYKPPWFYPAPGEVKNWDIQINAPYSLVPGQRAMMVVDLWDVAPASTITYDDNSMVTVPAGSQAGALTSLKAAGAVVICHVGTGAMRLDDPDAMKFPGYAASPPNRPDPIAGGSSIGWSTTDGDAMERFVDFRNPTAAAVLLRRVKLAKEIGCDGILAYRNDGSLFGSTATFKNGFTDISPADETAWIVKVAKQGHDLMISVGGRDTHTSGGLTEIVDDYDWIVAEQCAEDNNCDLARPFLEAHRAVFGLDYNLTRAGTAQSITTVCLDWVNGQIDGVLKSAALDSTVREVCP